jgi:hypothetical protein
MLLLPFLSLINISFSGKRKINKIEFERIESIYPNSTQIRIARNLPSWSLEIPKIEILLALEPHKFFCKPLIEMNSKAKL